MFVWDINENAFIYTPEHKSWINSLPNRKEQRGSIEQCIITYGEKFRERPERLTELKWIAKKKGKKHEWAPTIIFGCLNNKCRCCDPRGKKRHNKGKNKAARVMKYATEGIYNDEL